MNTRQLLHHEAEIATGARHRLFQAVKDSDVVAQSVRYASRQTAGAIQWLCALHSFQPDLPEQVARAADDQLLAVVEELTLRHDHDMHRWLMGRPAQTALPGLTKHVRAAFEAFPMVADAEKVAVLDYGCVAGLSLQELMKHDSRLVGVGVDPFLLDVSNEQHMDWLRAYGIWWGAGEPQSLDGYIEQMRATPEAQRPVLLRDGSLTGVRRGMRLLRNLDRIGSETPAILVASFMEDDVLTDEVISGFLRSGNGLNRMALRLSFLENVKTTNDMLAPLATMMLEPRLIGVTATTAWNHDWKIAAIGNIGGSDILTRSEIAQVLRADPSSLSINVVSDDEQAPPHPVREALDLDP